MDFFPDSNRNTKFNHFFWIGLLIIMLMRTFYFGITYFHFLDDYNTYGIFNRRNYDIFNEIILRYQLYTFRPIAFLSDAYITQWFWPNMWLVLLFYTLMHFVTVYLFYKCLKLVNINFGAFGIIIISLTPILFEAVYWIGASTRLVSGMFFSILSSYFLLHHLTLEEKNYHSKRYLILYAIFNFISTGFYEQIIVFNFVFTCMIIFLIRYKIRTGFKLILSIPFLSTAFIGMFYLLLAPYGKVASRGALVSPSIEIFEHFRIVTRALNRLLVNVNYEISVKGFYRGMTLIESPLQWIALIIVIVITIVIFLLLLTNRLNFEHTHQKNYLLCITIGFILAISPFMPFYILQNSFMSPRTIYPAIFGMAIVLDTFLTMISSTIKLHILKAVISIILIIPFFIIYIAEVNNFKLLEEVDTAVMSNFLEEFENSAIDQKSTIILFNTQYTYADTTTKSHRLENITSSDWALIGKANATSKDFYFREMKPIQNENLLLKKWAVNENGLFGIDEELNVYHLYLRGDTLFIKGTDVAFGTLEYFDDEHFMFVLN